MKYSYKVIGLEVEIADEAEETGLSNCQHY